MECLTAEVLGIPEFDGGVFKAQVAEIVAPADDQLVYKFHDGHTVTKTWIRPRKKQGKCRKGAEA